MRASLKQSIKDTPAGPDDAFRYAKGSIVICNACVKPIAKLDRGIALGDKAGQMASAFKPLVMADLVTLIGRTDIDAGVRAWAQHLTPQERNTYLGSLREFRSGDPMICPLCSDSFVQVLSVEKNEVLDKAYVVELVTLPPEGQKVVPIRGKQLGATKDWIHEDAEIIE